MTFGSATPRFPLAVWQLQSGIARGGFNEHVHRPPVFSNVVVFGGEFMRLDRRAFPPPRAPVAPIRDGMANGNRRRPVALGVRVWAGHHGELSLTPSIFAAEGELTDLTVFRWHDANGEHAVGVNVWEPITRSVQTLHAVVDRVASVSKPASGRSVGVADGIMIASTPAWIGDLCQASRISRRACPRTLPITHLFSADVSVQPSPASPGQGSVQTNWFSISWRGEAIPTPSANHPPGFGHFEVTAGQVRHAAHYGNRVPLSQVKIPSSYIPTSPIPLGHRSWTTHPGRLIFGDCFANHLCYRWSEHGRTYQIDLHAWYPIAQTVAVLHAIVASTPAARKGSASVS